MTRAPEDPDLARRFAERYRHVGADVILKIEHATLGTDYGATSWTTIPEADRLGGLLGLGPGKRLLDIGSGAGWPGIYLARRSGSEVVLTDIPSDGLAIAVARAAAEGVLGRCRFATAHGARLPFSDDSFDAINHSDVLCCLEPKLAVLQALRGVIRNHGVMAFSVIFVPPGLTSAEREEAVAIGPPRVDSARGYPEMLSKAGWKIERQIDLSRQYAEATRRMLEAEEAHVNELRVLLGDDD